MKLSDADIVAIARREIQDSQGYDADVLADKRARALDYYYGNMDNTADGRSNIVSHDVADCVHSLMAQIMPMFTSSMLEFEPLSEEDEPQAQMESDYVKRMIEVNDGWQVLYSSAFDALLQGNGWVKVEVIDEERVHREQYPPEIDALALESLEHPTENRQEVSITKNDKGYEVERITTVPTFTVKSISPDVMLFSGSWDQFEMEELRFVAERKLFTQADLERMGFKIADIESVPDAAEDYWPAIRAREGEFQNDIAHEVQDTQDAEILKECFDCYIRIDLNNTGESELRHILIGGAVLFLNEPAQCIPYATGSPITIPHRIQGEGMYGIMKGVQEAKTDILRKYIDSLEVGILGRYEAVEGQVNMQDALSGRPNGVVRVRSQGAFNPLPVADVSGQAITGLNYLDTIREQRGGASLDMNDADRQLMQSSAAAATGMMANHEAMAGWYCSNLVNTLLKSTWLLIHKVLRYDMPEATGAKLRGKWVQVNPGDWQERKHVLVTAGMTTAERNNKIAGLTQVMSQQLHWMEQGFEGIITDRGKVFNCASDWIRAAMLGNPDEYLVDPDSEEAQQAAQAKQEQAEAQQQQMTQLQQQMVDLQTMIERQKIELEKWKHSTELEYKYFDSNLDARVKGVEIEAKNEVEEAKLTVQAATSMNGAADGG